MKKIKILIAIFLVGVLNFSCSGDDDGGQNLKVSFLPTKIEITNGTESVEALLNYNTSNQLESFKVNSIGYEFGYNEDGLINSLIIDEEGGPVQFNVLYSAGIISAITRVSDGIDIVITYADGRYDYEGDSATFNSQNQLIQRDDGATINYSTQKGPFYALQAQLVLYLIDFDDLFLGYLFARNEITAMNTDIGNFTFANETDSNGNITSSILIDEADQERFFFTIEYEERIINL